MIKVTNEHSLSVKSNITFLEERIDRKRLLEQIKRSQNSEEERKRINELVQLGLLALDEELVKLY